MVDFDSEGTVGLPAVDIERVSVLQRRYYFIDAVESYYKCKFSNTSHQAGLGLMRARLLSLFLQVEAMLRRRWDKSVYEEVKLCVFENNSVENVIGAYYKLSEELDKLTITKLDLRKNVNTSIAEEENKEAGF